MQGGSVHGRGSPARQRQSAAMSHRTMPHSQGATGDIGFSSGHNPFRGAHDAMHSRAMSHNRFNPKLEAAIHRAPTMYSQADFNAVHRVIAHHNKEAAHARMEASGRMGQARPKSGAAVGGLLRKSGGSHSSPRTGTQARASPLDEAQSGSQPSQPQTRGQRERSSTVADDQGGNPFYFSWSSAGFAYFPKGKLSGGLGAAGTRDDVPGVTVSNVSFSGRLRIWLDESVVGKVLDAVQVLFSIVSCVLYIYSTYLDDDPEWISWLDLAFAVVFATDYILRFIAATNKLLYIFEPFPMVDTLTVVPVFLEFAGDSVLRLDFLRMVRFLRVIRIFRIFKLLRVLRMYRVLRLSDDGITRQVMTMVWTLISIVFCAAGLIQIVEDEFDGQEMTFFQGVYFVVVTITTVGYGDYAPITTLGQQLTVVLILFTFIIIPLQAQTLAELIRQRPRHRGRYMVSPLPHVVVVGAVDYDSIRRFLAEFFHPVHGMQQTRVVIMSPHAPDTKLVHLLQQRVYQARTLYLEGTVFEDADLRRCGVHSAKACFVLSHGFRAGFNNMESDQATILRTAALRNASQAPEIFAELVDPAFKTQLLASGANHVMCTEELKMHVLAMSALCPGFGTMLANLLSSSEAPTEAQFMLNQRQDEADARLPALTRAASSRAKRGAPSPFQTAHTPRHRPPLTTVLAGGGGGSGGSRGPARRPGTVAPKLASLVRPSSKHGLVAAKRRPCVACATGCLRRCKACLGWPTEPAPGVPLRVSSLRSPGSMYEADFMSSTSSRSAVPTGGFVTWRHEYELGAAMEIYGIKLPDRYHQVRFSEAAMDVYLHFGATLFAVKVQLQRASSNVNRYVRAEDDVTSPTARHGGGGFTALPTRHHGGGRGGGSGRDDIDDDAKYNDAAKFRTGTSFDAGRSALVLNPGRDMRLRAGDLCFLVCLNDHTAYSIKKACESGDLPPLKPSACQTQAQREQGGAGRDAKDHGAGTSPGARRRHGAPNGPANGAWQPPTHATVWEDSKQTPTGDTVPAPAPHAAAAGTAAGTATPPANRGSAASAVAAMVLPGQSPAASPRTALGSGDVSKASIVGRYSVDLGVGYPNSPQVSDGGSANANASANASGSAEVAVTVSSGAADAPQSGAATNATAVTSDDSSTIHRLVLTGDSDGFVVPPVLHTASDGSGAGVASSPPPVIQDLLRTASQSARRVTTGTTTGTTPTNRPRGSPKTVVRRSSFVSQWRGNVLRGSNLAPPTVYLPFEHAEVTNPLALSHHTIVFPGESLGTLDSFLLALREVPQEQWTDVVVLSPDINAFMWHRINMFPRVYWYRGTPLSHSDLVRVAVTRAQAVVIMADPTPVGADGDFHALGQVQHLEKHMVDYSTIMTSYAIQSFERCHAHLVSELFFPSNGKFLRTQVAARAHTLSQWQHRKHLHRAFHRHDHHEGAAVNASVDNAVVVNDGDDVMAPPTGQPSSHPLGHGSDSGSGSAKLRLEPYTLRDEPTTNALARGLTSKRSLEGMRLASRSLRSTSGRAAMGEAEEEEAVAAALREEAEALRKAEAAMASGSALRHAATKEFFELASFAQGSFFSPRMMQLLLFQSYYNRYLISIVGGLLRCGMGSDIKEVHEDHAAAHEGHEGHHTGAASASTSSMPRPPPEDLANANPSHHIEFTGAMSYRRPSSQVMAAHAHAATPTHGSQPATARARGLSDAAAVDGATGDAATGSSPARPPRDPSSAARRLQRSNSWSDTSEAHRMPVAQQLAPPMVRAGSGSVLDLPNTPTQLLPPRKSPAQAASHTAAARGASLPVAGSFTQSFLRQLPVPEIMVGQTYGALFRHLVVTMDALPLSVLRAAGGATRAPHAYVYTNPPATTRMSAGDRVFCLVHE